MAFPGSGHGAQAGGATVRLWPGRGAGCRQTSGRGSEMASEPPCAPGSPEAPDKGKKTVSQQCEVQPPLVHSGDIEHPPQKLHRAALVRGYGRFHLSIVEARQAQLLSRLDPLEVGKRSLPSEKHPMPEEKFWGDQESLSKVRPPGAGARSTGLTPTRGEGAVSRVRDLWGPTWHCQGPLSEALGLLSLGKQGCPGGEGQCSKAGDPDPTQSVVSG